MEAIDTVVDYRRLLIEQPAHCHMSYYFLDQDGRMVLEVANSNAGRISMQRSTSTPDTNLFFTKRHQKQ